MKSKLKINSIKQHGWSCLIAILLCLLFFVPEISTAKNTDTGYRYLRLTAQEGVSTYDAFFFEIEWMLGTTSYPTVKMTEATKTAVSATVETANAWHAYDGVKSFSGNWAPNVTSYPYSITCDLGAGVSINPSGIKIAIEWNARALASFTCEGSNDKTTWTNLYTKNGLKENDWVRDATNSFVFPVPDIQAPTLPGNLAASNITQSGFTLTWTASTDNVAVASYEIFKNGISIGTTQSTTFNVTGLASSSGFDMTVKAKDTSGNLSAASIVKSVTTIAPDLTAPTKPGNPIASAIIFSGFTLTWPASTDNVAVASYEIFIDSKSYGTTTGTSHNISGLTASTSYILTVAAKDAAGNTSPISEPTTVTTPDYVAGISGFIEDFNDNTLTGWYDGGYGLSAQQQALKVIPVKAGVWDGFGLSFPEINIKNSPYISLKIKSNFDFNVSLAIGKAGGKIDNYPKRIETIGNMAQEIVASGAYQTYSFDFTGLAAGVLEGVSNLHIILNPLTRDFGNAPAKEIWFDDIRIGDLALHTPAISTIQDQIFTINASGNKSRTVYFRNITDGSTDKNKITITATSSNSACIPDPQVVYTSPKRTGSLVLSPNLASAGESTISVLVSSPNTSPKTMTFKVKVVSNMAPSMKPLPEILVVKGEKISIPLNQIDDGNTESTQEIQISGTSTNPLFIPELTVKHDSTSLTGTLSFITVATTPAGTEETIRIRLKDNGGIASAGIDTSIYSFKVKVYDEINHRPTLDSIPPKSEKALAGQFKIQLSGIGDGDINTQNLSFEASSPNVELIKNLSVGSVADGKVYLNYELTGQTGHANITIKATDDGGNAGNNGNQYIVRSFDLNIVPVPITGLVADYIPFINNVAGSGISNDQNGGKVEILADGTVHLSGTVMQQTFPSAYFDLGKLTNGKELDISANKYVSFKFKGASTTKIEAPEKKALDKTKIFFRLVDHINPGTPGSGYNVSFQELNIPNDNEWHNIYLDFNGYFGKTKDGKQTDSTRISRLMLDINDLWFQQITGDYYIKDIKLGDQAERPTVNPKVSLNNIPDQVVYLGQRPRPILLSGISDGLGKPTANLSSGVSKTGVISDLIIGDIINGTALLNYSLASQTTDSVQVTLIAQNIGIANAIPDTVVFKVFVMDTTLVAAAAAKVTIDFNKTYQTIAGLGTMLNNGNDPIQIQQIKDLNITLMRLTGSGDFEPVNDNSDPNVADYSRFNRKALPIDVIREVNEKTNCHKFFYTPWTPPHWMKHNKGENPDPSTQWATNNRLKPEMYNEFAEYLVALCKMIKEEAGVELYAISLQNEPTFNEPYVSCQYNGAEFRELVKVVGPRLKAENLSTRIMLSEDVNANNWLQSNVGPANADIEARKYLGVIACHLYDPDGVRVGGEGSANWKSALSFTKTTPAEGIWMTETSGFSNVWEGFWGKDYLSGNPQFFPGPLDFAGSIYTSFKVGQISGWTDLEGTVYKTQNNLAGAVFKNFSAYIQPGAVMVDAISNNKGILSLAFKNTDHSITTILLNISHKPVETTLAGTGVPRIFRAFATQNNSAFAELKTVTTGSLVLAPRSITTLVHSAANLAPEINVTGNVMIDMNEGAKEITLSGIGYGADPLVQEVTSVTATSGNSSILSTQLNYTAGATTAVLKINPLAYGTSQISVTVNDNGGTEAGGIDATTLKFFVTVVNGLNRQPKINTTEAATILEDAENVSIQLTGISDGDLNTQSLQFSISSSNEELVLPSISYEQGATSASLIFKPKANQSGLAQLNVILTDNGGTETNNGNQSFAQTISVTVLPVNDAPIAKAILTTATVKAGIMKRFPVTVADGDLDFVQKLSGKIRNPNQDIADVSIVDNQSGTMTVNVKGKKQGVANFSFILKDDGGILNQGVDSVSVDFSVTIESSVGIDDLNSSGISLYPNPANDYIVLKLNNEQVESIVVTDVNGNIVLKQAVVTENNECKLSIAKLPSGVYFMTVKQGKQTNTLRFIHQK